jgi:hypothetical protein
MWLPVTNRAVSATFGVLRFGNCARHDRRRRHRRDNKSRCGRVLSDERRGSWQQVGALSASHCLGRGRGLPRVPFLFVLFFSLLLTGHGVLPCFGLTGAMVM